MTDCRSKTKCRFKLENDEQDLDLFHQEALNIARIAGKFVREAFDKDKRVETKECDTDLVTETDQESERIIIKYFKEKFPMHSFIGEESVAAGEKCNLTDNPTWIVDPIDGTTNFVHKFPFVSISIALAIKKELVIGVIYNCILDNMYSAIVGRGATCNGKPIKISGQTEVNKALLLSEIGADRAKERIDGIMHNLRTLITEPHLMAHSVRSLGSAALNMCYVAAGKCDGYFEFGIHCWDIAAGVVIIQEAGGVCLNASGEPVDIMSRQVVCGSAALTKKLCGIITAIPHTRD